MKTLAEQKRLINKLRKNLRNEIANDKDVDEKQFYQFYMELNEMDENIKSYQNSLYYGKSPKYVAVAFILFLIIIIWIVMK